MAARVPLEFANQTMRLARPISDAEGRLVAGAGTTLSQPVLRALRKLAIQTVVVENDTLALWECAQDLDDQLQQLERKLDREPTNEAMVALRSAITRHLCKRAVRLEQEQGSE